MVRTVSGLRTVSAYSAEWTAYSAEWTAYSAKWTAYSECVKC